MKGAAVGTLLLSGLLSLSHATPKKTLHFVRDKMDWPSARDHCVANFVDLASIGDATDLALLSGSVETADQYAFVGLRRDWRWSTVETEDQREAEVKFNKFEDGEPQEQNTCGIMKPSGEWATLGCPKQLPFICYDENVSDRFVKGQGTLKFPQARYYCRTHHTDLARIRNEAENQRVASLCGGTQAWIGLKKTWVWSDGTFAAFMPWSSKGKNHCAALHVTGEPLGIVDWGCNETLPFFCYSFAQKMYTVKIKLSAAESDVDLGDSVADSVTKLLRSKLNEQGFSKDIRLTWRKRPQKVEPAAKPEELHCPGKISP